MDFEPGFLFLLLLVAFLYASVGHGGASGYLALMALYGFAPEVMKPTALLLNIFVASTAFVSYYRGGYFSWQLFWPFALAAVPAAYFGGILNTSVVLYKQLLGAFLLVAVLRFVLPFERFAITRRPVNPYAALLIGAGIGLFSGMIGIGGGIILSPLLILLGWADMKQAAAVSALFILINSVSGLFGQLQTGVSFSPDMVLYVGVAFLGGLGGAYSGAFKFDQTTLKICLAIVLFIASIKLLLTG